MRPAGFKPRIPSKQAAADPRLRQLRHWDHLSSILSGQIITDDYPGHVGSNLTCIAAIVTDFVR
jgi:hypothetical protein